MGRVSGRPLIYSGTTLRAIAVLLLLLFFPGLVRAASPPSEAPYRGLKVYHIQAPTPGAKTVSLFSWSLREADILDVLLTFAKGSGYNIVVEPGVAGKVTLDLNMVSFEQTLKYFLEPLGLEYKWEGDFVRVFNPRLITRIFQLDYVNVQRTGQGSLTISSAGGYSGSITNTTSMDTWTAVIDGLVTIIFEGKGGGAGKGGAFSQRDSQGRKLIVNPQAGVILVTAIEEKLQEVAKFLEAVQSAIRRQVMIQTKIVEVVLSDEFQLGINWSQVADIAELSGTLAGGAALLQRTFFNPTGTFQLGIADDHISVLLDAMATQGKLNTLSSPQIVALNNQTAMIKVAREEVYYEITTQTETTEQTDRVIEASTPISIDVGIVLYVTPQIGADGSITLNIHPSISEITGEAVSRLGDTKPIIERRETNTMVRIRDGQTIVMAGLIKDRINEDLTMVPCLGNLPWIGYLFRHTDRTKEKSELVIMLTPTILKNEGLTIIKQPHTQDLEKLFPKHPLDIPIIVDRMPDISLNKSTEEYLVPVNNLVVETAPVRNISLTNDPRPVLVPDQSTERWGMIGYNKTVNLRETPNLKGKIIGKLSKQKFSVLDKVAGWYQIKRADQSGYVWGGYVKPLSTPDSRFWLTTGQPRDGAWAWLVDEASNKIKYLLHQGSPFVIEKHDAQWAMVLTPEGQSGRIPTSLIKINF